jgi:hypothetical protein
MRLSIYSCAATKSPQITSTARPEPVRRRAGWLSLIHHFLAAAGQPDPGLRRDMDHHGLR